MRNIEKAVVLGSGGVIGKIVAQTLSEKSIGVRLFSRKPVQVNGNDDLSAGDLLVKRNVADAVGGMDVAFLTAGLKYDAKVWRKDWPLIMSNVIEACAGNNCRLVFFDNCYLYGRVTGAMTEQSPANPCSVKGEVRAKISDMLMRKAGEGSLAALIARSADFYGPDTPLSFVNAVVFDRLAKGKKPMWLVNDKVRHSFTFTPDAGKATVLLGLSENAYGQVWHLPTDPEALTGKQFIEEASRHFGKDGGFSIVSKGMQKFLGLFNKALKENVEMLYQNEFEYLFDSSKFEKAFGCGATRYSEGIRITAESSKNSKK